MKQSLRLGTISGIPVGLNWGLLIIAFLYLTSLSTSLLPSAAPGFSGAAYWLTGLSGVVLFFGSILAHELGHSLVAQREGIRVKAITLWLLGGVAEIESDAPTARAEFRIAAAGPAVSIVLAFAFFGAGVGFDRLFDVTLVGTMLRWLGLINGVLAVFNLIPAAPLDGGRILTAVLWARSGSQHGARTKSAVAGQAFGLLMIALGAFLFFNGGNIFILIMAWFLFGAATSERRRAELFSAAAHASVGDVMAPLASATEGAVTASGLVAMGDRSAGAYPVRGPNGSVVGMVPMAALRALPQKRRDHVRADELVIPWNEFVSARSDESLTEVLTRFQTTGHMHALVYNEYGDQVGYVGMGELSEARNTVPV